MCIEDNSCFCSGGGHTLVGSNMCMLHVQCMEKFFRFPALLGIVVDL